MIQKVVTNALDTANCPSISVLTFFQGNYLFWYAHTCPARDCISYSPLQLGVAKY